MTTHLQQAIRQQIEEDQNVESEARRIQKMEAEAADESAD